MIQIERLEKGFDGTPVLRGVTLDVPAGRNTVVIGASGSGKSVLLKCVIGLLKPEGGRVEVDDRVVGELDRDGLAALRGIVGYVFQFAALFDSLTVEENLRLGLARRGLDEATIRARINESLQVVDLADAGPRYPSELSGGMRKRVGIARAIALHPRYILYDEPTTGLDPVTSAVITQLMVRARDLGVTGMIVTHDMTSAFTAGDRIAMLHDGVIREVGSPDAMRESADPVVRRFIEGRPDPEPAPAGAAR